jgi:signal transduction histidine kinase
VATGILHNVGNVLNSVNVSANLAQTMLRHSRAGGISKIAELLRAHGDDLAKVAALPAGKRLPTYIAGLAEAVASEQQQVQAELLSLTSKIEHIKVIVSLQQSHAKSGGVIERLSIVKLIEDALALRCSSSEKHQIEVVRQLEDAELDIDRHKLLQIVTNLLSNAWHAVREAEGAKRVIVRSQRRADGIAIAVEDNGCGIAPEALPRIFSHGYTTKREGHGFGLHSAACAAAEMGGRMTVESAGVGKGATFTLILPTPQAILAAA